MIYLDSGATTLQKPAAVPRATARAMTRMASPGRGGHRPAALAAETVYRCREEAAALFDVPSPEQVVFTSSATHGLNIALASLVKPGDTILLSGYEHNAVTRPLAAADVTVRTVRAPLFDAEAFLDAFDRALAGKVDCVVLTHVSNVFGFILPVEEASHRCAALGVPLIVDASQSAGCLPVRLDGWKAAFVAMPGHKGLYGPQGTGILLCGRPGECILRGGTGSASRRQEMPEFLPDRQEAGTHNVCGIAGLLEGLRFVRRSGPEEILAHEQALCRRLARGLEAVPGLQVFAADRPERQSGVLSVRHERMDCETLGAELARRDIAVRAGLHCAPYAHAVAGTLETGTVRLSFSAFNTPEEVDRTVRTAAQILRETQG